jgi:hypothetical protein
MSLYDSGIQLLPRPPRSAFSMGNESTRATIPDFNNVTELSHFTNRLFNWHIPISSLFIQAIFTSVLIFIMVIVVTLIMATKIYQGKFWLIRVIRKSNETINVVSIHPAFSLYRQILNIVLCLAESYCCIFDHDRILWSSLYTYIHRLLSPFFSLSYGASKQFGPLVHCE